MFRSVIAATLIITCGFFTSLQTASSQPPRKDRAASQNRKKIPQKPRTGQKRPQKKPVASAVAIGKPKAYKVDVPARYYLWHSDGVWHLRTTSNRRGGINFRGLITAKNCRIQYCKSIARETGLRRAAKRRGIKKSQDIWRLSGDKTRITFLLLTGKLADGLDFKIQEGNSKATLHFDLLINGRKIPQRIFLGRSGVRPHSSSFSLDAEPKP